VVKAATKEVYLAKQVATIELGSAKKLPKTPKGEREETLTWKVGKEGHQQKRKLPRRKPLRTTSKWWNNSNPPPIL